MESPTGTLLNLTNQRFGSFVVQGPIKRKRREWICLCDCGGISVVASAILKRGSSKSCGKCDKEFLKKYHKEYNIWASMKSRCQNKNHTFYKDYGGRGVKIDDPRWQVFKNFLVDMGAKPLKKSLDRIDNTKGYSKENCRWSTQREQKNNCRNNVFLTYKEKTQTTAQWARELKINYATLKTRLNVLKMSPEKALSMKVKINHAKV